MTADPTMHDGTESSALHQVALNNDIDVFKLLLTYLAYEDLKLPAGLHATTGEEGKATSKESDGSHGHQADHEGSSNHGANSEISHTPIWRPSLSSGTLVDDLHACLLVAAGSGQLTILRLLFEYCIRLDQSDLGQDTALYLASLNGHQNAVDELVRHGCQKDARNAELLTPLQLASRSGHLKVVELLVSYGADITASPISSDSNASTESALSAIEIATKAGHANIVKYLLDWGPQLTPRTLKLAAGSGHTEVIGVLMSNRERCGLTDPHRVIAAAHAA